MFYRGVFSPFNPFASFFPLLIGFFVFDLVLKAIALWKSARNSQKVWFAFLLIINSLGLLPIIYLVFFQKKSRKH